MERTQYGRLIRWKEDPRRKPLLIRGARQVGKTWLMKEFGRREYPQTMYVNFESSRHLAGIFDSDFDIRRVLDILQIETGVKFHQGSTLIILDEIQEVPAAITALKYFYETAPEIPVICAGSMLGVALHRSISYPVGKIEFMDLYPLSYYEFLDAMGQRELVKIVLQGQWEQVRTFRHKFIQYLRQYYYVGGMPEAVHQFSKKGDYQEVNNIQKAILQAYEQDFSKHIPVEMVPRIRMVWNSIPVQLAKENKKFVYGHIREGARAREFELAITWLTDCGLIYKINRITKPAMPLKAYTDMSAFKLFLVDTGLLTALAEIDVKTLIEGNTIFQEFKGALTEQYVLQQLISTGEFETYYWSAERSSAELDFLLQYENHIIPLEVKAEENLQSKSLRVYRQKYAPPLAVRTSMSDFRRDEMLTNIPLYAIGGLSTHIGQSSESI